MDVRFVLGDKVKGLTVQKNLALEPLLLRIERRLMRRLKSSQLK